MSAMLLPEGTKEAPWDARALEIPAYEITAITPEVEEWLEHAEGFFTLKLPSTHPKGRFERLGFYYCDTLLQPSCNRERFKFYDDERCALTADFDIEDFFLMVRGSFTHDRFHKDTLIADDVADDRYIYWLKDLHRENCLMAFLWDKRELAGFWGYTTGGSVVLNTFAENFRGRGLAKFFWTTGCRLLFDQKIQTITTSVSASNLGVMNLCSSLGFSMKNAVDVYHLFKPLREKKA